MILKKADTCEEFRAALDDDNQAFYYASAYRAYGLMRIDPGDICAEKIVEAKNLGSAPDCWLIHYCPWSGEPLPLDLVNLWEETIVATFGEERHPWVKDVSDLPEAFRSEGWWLERNIVIPDNHTNRSARNNWPNRAIIQPELVPWDEPWEPFCDPELPGMSRWPQKPVHHCWEAEMIWWGPRFMYAYIPYTREFGVRIIDVHQPVDRQPIRIEPVRYCPFCGDLLPASLRDEWRTRTAAAGFDPDDPPGPIPETWPKGFPEDLASDNWWREDGL